MRTLLLLMSTGVLVGSAMGAGCHTPQPNHCSALEGDATCSTRGQGRYCDGCQPENDGCVDVEPTPDCYVPGPRDESASGDTEATTREATTTIESSSEPAGTTVGAGECEVDEDCVGPAAPFCSSEGECVSCSGASDPHGACDGLGAGTPLCEDGVCVQCTEAESDACRGTTPVCDDMTRTCVCTAHAQCGEAACNFYTRACLPPDAVVHVMDGGGGVTLAQATAGFSGAGVVGTVVVHGGTHQASVVVGSGSVLALLVHQAEQATWRTLGAMAAADEIPQLTVEGTVLMDGLILADNPSMNHPAVLVDGGRAWVDDSRIINNADGGILARDGAEVTVRNSFIGSGLNAANSVEVIDGSATILYSTLAAGAINATALSCSSPMAVVVRNSILVAWGAGKTAFDVACDQADITFTATEANVLGMGNREVGQLSEGDPENWFVNYTAGNFHLQNEGLNVFDGIAQWRTGDPLEDIDGHLRPTDGALHHAGADVP